MRLPIALLPPLVGVILLEGVAVHGPKTVGTRTKTKTRTVMIAVAAVT